MAPFPKSVKVFPEHTAMLDEFIVMVGNELTVMDLIKTLVLVQPAKLVPTKL